MKFADFLNEAPLPDNWEKAKFNNGTFKSMIEYATAMSEKVGSGSSRVVFKALRGFQQFTKFYGNCIVNPRRLA